VAEDLSFNIKGDISGLIEQFNKLGTTSENVANKISKDLAEALGGDFTTKVQLEVEADTGQLKLVQRETNAFIEALVSGLQRIERAQAKLAADQAKAFAAEEAAAQKASDKREQLAARRRASEEKAAKAREEQIRKEEEATKKAADKAIADAQKQYDAYLRGLQKRQQEERAAEEKRLKDIQKTNAAAEAAAKKQEAVAARLRAEQERINAAAAKEAQIRSGSLTDLNRKLQKEQEILSNLKRGTDEYEKQAKIVQELSRARRIEVTGLSGKQIDAQDAGAKIGQVIDGFNRLSFAASAAIGIVGGLGNAFGNFTRVQSDLESFRLSFEAIGEGSSGATVALAESAGIATRLGVELTTIRDGFQRLSPVILQSGGTLGDVSAIMESLASRFAVFGRSADESKRIMNGVVQAFGKGKLMAEELNQQISEADPAFRVDLADAIGVSVAQLTEMVKQGELTSDQLIKYIPLMSKAGSITQSFGSTALSAAQALAQGNAKLTQFQAQLANIARLNLESLTVIFKPLIGSILVVQAAVADLSTQLINSEAFKAFANIVNATGQSFSVLAVAVAELAKVVLAVLAPFAALLNTLLEFKPIAMAVGVLISATILNGLRLLTVQLGAAAAASNAFSGAFVIISKAFSQIIGPAQQAIVSLLNFKKAKDQVVQVKVTDLGAGLSGALRNVATSAGQATSAIVKYNPAVAAANAESAKVTQAARSAGLANVALTAAVIGVTVAWESYTASLGKSREIASTLAEGFTKIDEELQQFLGSVDGGSQGLDVFNQKLEELANKSKANIFQGIVEFFSQENQKNLNAFQREFLALSDAFRQTEEQGLGIVSSLKNFKGASEEGAEATAKLEAQVSAYIKKQELLISETKKARDAALQKALADGILSEKEKEGIEQLNELTRQSQRSRDATLELAQAKGISAKASQDAASAEEALVNKIKELGKAAEEQGRAQIEALRSASEQRITALEEQKRAAQEGARVEIEARQQVLAKFKETSQAQIEGLQAQKARARELYDAEKSQLEELKSAVESQKNAALAAIDQRKTAMNALYDAELARLDEQKAAINSQLQAQLGALNAPGPAERKLQEIELAKLREQAARGETFEERLRAQAQLERIDRERQASIVRAQAAQRVAAIERQQAELKKKQEEELKKLEEERRKVTEEARQLELKLLAQIAASTKKRSEDEKKADKEIADQKKADKETEKKLQQDIDAAKKNAQAAEREFETQIRAEKKKTGDQIKAIEAQIKQAKDEVNASATNVLRTEQAIAGILQQQLAAARELARLRGGSTAAGPARFAGGPTSGGKTYTVNELGQEAFLSRSGKLSKINAPSWGQWRAPGAGTVIPAHVTAGLDIPSGGINVNAAAPRNASRVDGSGMTAAIMRAFAGGSQGRVTNNVTIQSQSPVSDASRMLVEMSKIRARRK
jgi:tape measure domain-containing protein